MNKTPLRRFHDAQNRERDEGQTPEIIAELRKVICDGLLAFSREKSDVNFDSEMARYLHLALLSLNENHDHPLFIISGRRRGSPGMTLDERDCVADAVRYIRAAREGVINDLDPIDTVLIAYAEKAKEANLDVRTIQRWLKRDDMKNVFPADVKANLIEDTMRFSARFYGQNFSD